MDRPLTIEIGCGNVKDLRFDIRFDIKETPATNWVGDMRSLSLGWENTFALAKMSAVIEHVTPDDQVKTVKELYKALIPHGIVIVQTPDRAYWEERLTSEDAYEREWAGVQMRGGERDEYDRHLGLLDAEGLRNLFESNGFRTVQLHDGKDAAGSLDGSFECLK